MCFMEIDREIGDCTNKVFHIINVLTNNFNRFCYTSTVLGFPR